MNHSIPSSLVTGLFHEFGSYNFADEPGHHVDQCSLFQQERTFLPDGFFLEVPYGQAACGFPVHDDGRNLLPRSILEVIRFYAVTEEDRRILEAPIPLIIASINESIQRTKVRPYDSASELKLPGKIRIGASGANVIVVRRKDKNALTKLLRELPVPITDMQIRVDDTIF